MEAGEVKRGKAQLKTSSTAEYFAKNLQQVGFSSPTKAVLTTLKEAFDNSLDACEDHEILPAIRVEVEKQGKGSTKNTDLIYISVQDNGPGIPFKELPMVFGEYLASSKFGRGRCTRGQQGIGISAATTWAMQTAAQGVKVTTKTKGQKKAVQCRIEIDLKHNKGLMKDKIDLDWAPSHGTRVEFWIDGRVQVNGEAGLLAFLKSNVLVNPHLELTYKLMDEPEVFVERVSDQVPQIPDATAPHPHTMKLGEFMGHGKLYGNIPVRDWLTTAFSRMNKAVFEDLTAKHKVPKKLFDQKMNEIKEADFKNLFTAIQEAELPPPSTGSVLAIGEEGLARSILRLGDLDYFSVVSRKPAICDFKPVQVEVAIARMTSRNDGVNEGEESCEVIRFANRVPLQFDKASCAIMKAITSVNWKVYGLKQSRNSPPSGPYIVAVSVVSPFIKFKNASKETIDASEELVEEIRRTLMQAGQRLSRHLRKEHKEAMLESKMQHIEQFAPILVEGLVRLTASSQARREQAHKGLLKILGREAKDAKDELAEADRKLEAHLNQKRKRLGAAFDLVMAREDESDEDSRVAVKADSKSKKSVTKLKKGVIDKVDVIKPDAVKRDAEVHEKAKVSGKVKKKNVAKSKAENKSKSTAEAKTKTKTKTKAQPVANKAPVKPAPAARKITKSEKPSKKEAPVKGKAVTKKTVKRPTAPAKKSTPAKKTKGKKK
ncbi:MAG: DNA topoisomerase VI subunit B [Chitinophagaceae bacterium]|nr:DNA topoisomerase VI subunit B [Oligoflexus sp.]